MVAVVGCVGMVGGGGCLVVVGGGGWWWVVVVVCKPILVFSLSKGQAEQYLIVASTKPFVSNIGYIVHNI